MELPCGVQLRMPHGWGKLGWAWTRRPALVSPWRKLCIWHALSPTGEKYTVRLVGSVKLSAQPRGRAPVEASATSLWWEVRV